MANLGHGLCGRDVVLGPLARASVHLLDPSGATWRAGGAHVARGWRAVNVLKNLEVDLLCIIYIFTFINISTVNFELGNGLPREFWA